MPIRKAITASNSPATFKISIPTDQWVDGLVRWVTTNDNDNDLGLEADGSDRVDSGPAEGEPSTHGPIAVTTMSVTTAPINGTKILPLDSNLPNGSYAVYTFSTTAGMPNPAKKTEVEGWAFANPVPPSTGITFSNVTGMVDGNGDSGDPSGSVPNDFGLVSEFFYLVAFVSVDDPAGTRWIGSGVKTITITTP